MPSGTSGTGYVGIVTLGTQYVTSFQVLYAANQSITTTAPVSITLSAPGTATFTSTVAASTPSGNILQIGATAADNTIVSGYLVPGMAVAGLALTSGTGYIYQINGSASGTGNTPAAPGGQTTSVMIYFPAGAPTNTTTYTTAVTALPPVGAVQPTVAGVSVYTGVPIYGLGTGQVSLPVNSIITTYPPSVTGTGGTIIFQVTAISYQSAGVALATLTLYGTASDNSGAITAAAVSSTNPLLSIITTAPVFKPSFPVVNLLLQGTPSGTITTGSTVLGQASVGNNPLGTINAVYGAITGFGYLVSVNLNQVLTAGMPASTQDTYYSATSLSFVPSSYQCGILTTSSMPGYTQTGGKAGPITFTQGSGGTPSVGSYVYTTSSTGAGTTLTNPTIAPTTTSSQLYISYTAATAGTAWTRYTQFAIIPTASIYSQLSTTIGSGQPGVDRQGSAIISLAFIAGSGTVAVGQGVIGTQYSGPVTVSQVVSTSGTYAGTSSDTATIEIQFPVQSKQPNTQTG
jgi:hypothetical protein